MNFLSHSVYIFIHKSLAARNFLSSPLCTFYMLFYPVPLLLPQFVHPTQRQAHLRYLHTDRGAVNFVLVGPQCYLKPPPPRHDHS
jgi:hypothetical protein